MAQTLITVPFLIKGTRRKCPNYSKFRKYSCRWASSRTSRRKAGSIIFNFDRHHPVNRFSLTLILISGGSFKPPILLDPLKHKYMFFSCLIVSLFIKKLHIFFLFQCSFASWCIFSVQDRHEQDFLQINNIKILFLNNDNSSIAPSNLLTFYNIFEIL